MRKKLTKKLESPIFSQTKKILTGVWKNMSLKLNDVLKSNKAIRIRMKLKLKQIGFKCIQQYNNSTKGCYFQYTDPLPKTFGKHIKEGKFSMDFLPTCIYEPNRNDRSFSS